MKREGPLLNNGEINLSVLYYIIWNSRKIIVQFIIYGMLTGIILSFFKTNKYVATAVLIPTSERVSDMGGISDLAGMAGISLGNMIENKSSIISPEILPQLVYSVPFCLELSKINVYWEDDNEIMSYYTKRLSDTLPSLSGLIINYTLKLPWTLKNALMKKRVANDHIEKREYIVLKNCEMDLIGEFREMMSVTYVDGIVQLSVETSDPQHSAELTQSAIKLLQKYITNFKTQKAKEDYEQIERNWKLRKTECDRIQMELLSYEDQNRGRIKERSNIEYLRLVDSYDVQFSFYKAVSQQLESARMSILENTPSFAILEPVVFPNEKSKPNRVLLVAVCTFIAFFFSIIYILFKESISKKCQ